MFSQTIMLRNISLQQPNSKLGSLELYYYSYYFVFNSNGFYKLYFVLSGKTKILGSTGGKVLVECYLSLTARSNIRITAIHIKAVRNKSKRMVVRGRTRACNWLKIRIQSQFSHHSVLTCSPPRRRVRIKEHARDAGKPIKESIRSLSDLLFI